MKEIIKIEDFIKTGNFDQSGKIQFGMCRNTLIEHLGKTKYVFKSRKSKIPSIYKYGKIEFYFEDGKQGRLYGIQIKPNINEAPALNLRVDYNFLKPDLKFEEAIQILESKSIGYELIIFEFDDDDSPQRILVNSNVQFIFDDNSIIEKVSKFIELNNKPKMKQISISLPEIKYKTLREMAIETNTSIQNICKKIILDKLNE